jgi:hypothetical protein
VSSWKVCRSASKNNYDALMLLDLEEDGKEKKKIKNNMRMKIFFFRCKMQGVIESCTDILTTS